MSIVEQLWHAGEVPIINGLIYPNDTYRIVDVASSNNRIFIKETGNVQHFLDESPAFISDIDNIGRIESTDAYCEFGGAAHGSEGYLACLDPQTHSLRWIFFSQHLNPLVAAHFVGANTLIARTELERELVFTLYNNEVVSIGFNN